MHTYILPKNPHYEFYYLHFRIQNMETRNLSDLSKMRQTACVESSVGFCLTPNPLVLQRHSYEIVLKVEESLYCELNLGPTFHPAHRL